jgi:hypothetical protein
MMTQTNTSILGSLLREISWVGGKKLAQDYRDGGLGIENVLTAEVLQGLDFLPRQHFLGAVISEFEGEVLPLKTKLLAEIEQASVSLLSEHFYLRPSEKSHDAKIDVQPDGFLVSPSVFGLIECKPMKSSSFGLEQLAREFVIVTREAKGRLPLLLLILGEEPPVRVKGAARQAIRDAILDKPEEVWGMTEGHHYSCAELRDMVAASVAWITWRRVSEVVDGQMRTFTAESPSVRASIQRLADAVTGAIDRHRLSRS